MDRLDALSVGKIKNKVLKLTGEVQGINIKVRRNAIFILAVRNSFPALDCPG